MPFSRDEVVGKSLVPTVKFDPRRARSVSNRDRELCGRSQSELLGGGAPTSEVPTNALTDLLHPSGGWRSIML